MAVQGRQVPRSYQTHIHTHSQLHIHTLVLHTCTYPNSHPTCTHRIHKHHSHSHILLTLSHHIHTHTHHPHTHTGHIILTHTPHTPHTYSHTAHPHTTYTLTLTTHTAHTHLVKLGSSAPHQELRAVTCLPWLRDLLSATVLSPSRPPPSVCPGLIFSLCLRHRTQKPERTGSQGENCGERQRELALSPVGQPLPSCSGTVGLGLLGL